MLPKSQDRPSILSKLSGDGKIPSHVSLNLVPPESFWQTFLFMILVPMPKITVTEYDNPLSWKYEIRITEHFWIHFVFISRIAQHLVHLEINLGVCSPDSRHDPRTLFRSKYIRHYFSLTCREILFITNIFTNSNHLLPHQPPRRNSSLCNLASSLMTSFQVLHQQCIHSTVWDP